MKNILMCLILLTNLLAAQAKVNFINVKDDETWVKMLKLAEAENVNIFVYAQPSSCAECKTLNKTLFKSQKVSAYFKSQLLALTVPQYSEFGQELFSRYNLPNQASFLVFNTNKVLFYTGFGLVEETNLLADLESVQQKMAHYPAWQKGAKIGQLPTLDWIQFLLIEELNFRVQPKSPIVRDVSTLLDSSQFNLEPVQLYVMELGIDVDGPIFQTLKNNQSWIDTSAIFNWSAYFQRVFDFNVTQAIAQNDSVFLEDILYQLKQLPADAQFDNMMLRGRQIFCAENQHWKAYDTITMAYLQNLPSDSANAYQQEAMQLMEYYDANDAYDLVGKYLKLGLRKKETFSLYYTLGLYLYNTGDYNNAYRATAKAIELADNAEERTLAGKFLDYISGPY